MQVVLPWGLLNLRNHFMGGCHQLESGLGERHADCFFIYGIPT